jgi:mono/diheme cytochrome c family protein
VPAVTIRVSVVVLLTAFVAGCGGGRNTPVPAASADGAKLFSDNCSSCHTLKAAGAKGQVGPNLDQLRPGPDLVQRQVTNGGGGMPAFGGKLTAAQIQELADYVSKNAGS